MRLNKLLESLATDKVYGDVDLDITYIADDSRSVKKGNLFVAISGLKIDAHDFIPQAIESGAVAVIGEKKPDGNWLEKVTYVKVKSSRKALSYLAAAWFGFPSIKLDVIGITGTKGKTTSCVLLDKLLNESGLKTGLISSISAKIGEKEVNTGLHVTNPEPLKLHKLLSRMVKSGCKYAVLEVTSHGLDQERVAGIKFATAGLTNISHEHLDYHGSMQKYTDAKLKLFKHASTVVLNKDDDYYNKFKKSLGKRTKLLTYSRINKKCDYMLSDFEEENIYQTFTVAENGKEYRLRTSLLGDYNLNNVLLAIAVARKYGVGWNSLIASLGNFKGVKGRLESIENDKRVNIYIDFAHTPASLESVLKYLKDKTPGKLIAVFGCAGERDFRKRPMMGEISGRLADISVFTAEDPRSEKVKDIINEIVKGANKTNAVELIEYESATPKALRQDKNLYIRIPERGKAIFYAINSAAVSGDTVVICGKGHEESMAYNGVEYPWSDKKAVIMALDEKILRINKKPN